MSAFTIYWHRAGNTAAGVDAVHAARRASPPEIAGRPLRHGIEADLKWQPGSRVGAPHLYLYHGPTGLERLSLAEARRREAAGAIISVEALLARPDAAEIDYMIEIKRGRGDRAEALAACVDAFARRGIRDRLLFASSSIATLEDLARAHPDVPRLLFVSHLGKDGRRALHIPKIDVLRGLLRGPWIRVAGLDGAASAISPLGLFGRTAIPAEVRQFPRTTGVEETVAMLRAGMAGAFAYFEPTPLASS